MDLTQIFNFLIDVLFLYIFFLPVQDHDDALHSRKKLSPFRKNLRKIIAFALQLFLLPLYLTYMPADPGIITLRFAARLLIYSLFVYFDKQTTPEIAFYLGAIAWITFAVQNNMFQTPQFYRIHINETHYLTDPMLNQLLNRILEYTSEAVIIILSSKMIPLNEIHFMVPERIFMISTLCMLTLYIKYSLNLLLLSPISSLPKELTTYPVLMQMLILAFLIMFERYLYHRRLREESRLQETIARNIYANAVAHQKAQEDLRVLHHDMKNHLIALQGLMKGSEPSEGAPAAERYISLMMDKLAPFETIIETGNPVLNGLLSEKVRIARLDNIEISTSVDFRGVGFIENMDICTIFGNALDNAMEASRKVTDPELRSILVKAGCISDNLTITFTNYYEGTLHENRGVLLTIKTGAFHGIGLKSIERSVAKYHGTMIHHTDQFHNFTLTIRIPFPE
ncbi:hypothetical protein BXO88_06880 [Oribacterium sp. C9]|uniref:ATP-binding protein n=1 Tax=Oribacterium sp. C9 TaxID=1943579 RepID=UPI00098FB94F|nr:sensor histidine kinase [Oribacterium sp. C9]OON86710.1 hypothetical protein BXO88_06880 [Oribacterium sp. C9]